MTSTPARRSVGEPLFDDGPLDGTRLAADIAASCPGLNASVRRDEWRADLKRRVAARITQPLRKDH